MADFVVTDKDAEIYIEVVDSDTNIPIQIIEDVVQINDESISLDVENKEESVLISSDDIAVAVNDSDELVQPQFQEVLQVIHQTIEQIPSEEEVLYKEEIDFVGDTLVYRGWADAGSATSAAVWRIRRTRFIGADEDVIHDFADGDTLFNNIWDDRAGLSYN